MAKIFKESSEILKQAFKGISLRSLIPVLADIVLVVYVFLAFMAWIMVLTSQTMFVSSLPVGNILNSDLSKLHMLYWQLFKLIAVILGGLLLAFAGFIVLYSIFKYFTWSMIYGTKRTFKNLLKFFWLNLLWMGILAIPFVYVAIRFKSQIAIDKSIIVWTIVILFLIFIYFSGLMYYYFFREDTSKIVKAVQGAFFYSFRKAHYLLFWNILLLIVLALLMALAYALSLNIRIILIIIALLFYFALSRIIMSKVFERYLA